MNLLVSDFKKMDLDFANNTKCSVNHIPVNYTQALEERVSVILSSGLCSVWNTLFLCFKTASV